MMIRACLFAPVALLMTACGGDGNPVRSTPPPSPPPTTVALRIVGLPATLQIGQTLQLIALGVLADGSMKVVVPAWESLAPSVANVSPGGLVEAMASGEATIRATYETISATARVVVASQPSPTPPRPKYTIRGVVHEAPPHEGTPVAGAAVTIGGGADGGRTIPADANGRFALEDLAATAWPGFALRISKPGFRDASYRVLTLPRDETPDIAMSPVPGCAYEVRPAAYYSYDHVRNGSFEVVAGAECPWTATLIESVISTPGSFQFTGATSGIGPGRVTFNAFSNYGFDPFVFTVRVEGPNTSSAIYVVAVAAR
jgi:carboxypeptidase family protein/Big-like domain-containing protein